MLRVMEGEGQDGWVGWRLEFVILVCISVIALRRASKREAFKRYFPGDRFKKRFQVADTEREALGWQGLDVGTWRSTFLDAKM